MEAATSLVSRHTSHNASSFQTPARSVGQTSGLLSPSGRRMLFSLGSASKGSPTMSVEVLNDDQMEKRQKILESAKKFVPVTLLDIAPTLSCFKITQKKS